jgi:hypothetical protein
VDYIALDGFFLDESREFIELAGPAGTDLTDWRIDILIGSLTGNVVVASYSITNFTLPNDNNDYGFFVLGGTFLGQPPADQFIATNFYLEANSPGIVRLHNELGGVEDIIAFGGFVQGAEYVGVNDLDDSFAFFPEYTSSISRVGIGSFSQDFTWGSFSNTPGTANENQTFAAAPVFWVNTNALTFSYIPGSLPPPGQSLIVSNAGGSPLAYSIGANVAWLGVTDSVQTGLPPGGVVVHTVITDPAGLTGNRFGNLTLNGVAANNPVSINVSLLQAGLPDALVHYPFDDGAGDIVQNFGTAGSAANLTLTNAAFALEGDGASGLLNDFAYRSTTTTARAVTTGAVTALHNRARFTVTGWLNPSGTGGLHRIIGNRTATNGLALTTSANYQQLSLVSSASGAPTAVTSTNGSVPTGEWTFFAVTFDSTDNGPAAVVFYRGTRELGLTVQSTHTRGSLGATGFSTNRLFVGGTGSDGFVGRIDDLRIHAAVLDTMSIEGIRQSGATRLTGVGAPPKIDEQPQNQSVPPNGNADFFVDASGLPLPQYQWRKSGVNLPGQNSDNLNLQTVQAGDAGTYDVVVFNAFGSVTSETVTLSIDGTLFFLAQPTDRTVYEGENVLFEGTASVTNATYQWAWGGTNLIGSTNATLLLTNVLAYQAGGYRVVAGDGLTSITSTVGVLTVVPMEFDPAAGGGIIRAIGVNGVVLAWPSIADRVYDVRWTTNLKAGTHAFITIATNLPATPTVNSYTDTVHGAKATGIYRISAKPAP